jgi:hypothetical protein
MVYWQKKYRGGIPLKIFISYGHNDYTALVDRLFDALTEAGHQPWKDDRYEGNSGIAPGQDFTEVIYKAIDACDFVIAFVTQITRNKPYCRDERQYAYNKKGTHFIQIRMDNVEITLGNAQSYIDMSDSVDSTGRIREKLFENSLNAIFAAFRDPMSFAEGGITPWTKIDAHLKVDGSMKYHDFIAIPDRNNFVGRDWLLQKCRDWAQDATIARRLFVIYGEAGTGKTAFIRHLSRDEELVRSVHVCIYDRPSTRTIRDTLKDLSYVLAHRCEEYYGFLKSNNLEKLKDMSEDAMFEYLFLEPLKTVKEKYLLIIDGLDELEKASGLDPLMRIFRQYSDRINPNISFLVTTRPDEAITDLLKTVGKGKALESITLSKDTNRDDLVLYIDRKLRELGLYSEALAKKILDSCDGNFEYLSLLFQEAEEEGLRMDTDMGLPRGLNERYIQYLDRHMDALGLNKLSKQQRQLLSLLCAAREPMPLSLLADAADLDEYDVLDELAVFGSLIRQSEDRDPEVALFTKSFRDFLLSRDCRRYSVNSSTGTDLLANFIMDNIRREKDFTKKPYLDRNGFVHLLQYAQEEPEAVTEYMIGLSKTGTDIAARIADALCRDTETAVSAYFSIQNDLPPAIPRLRLLRAAAPLYRIVQLNREKGNEIHALRLESDLLLWDPSPDNFARAQRLLGQALELGQQAYRVDPCYESRQDLASVYYRLTDFYMDLGTAADLEKAEHCAERSLELNKASYLEKPCRQSRSSLSMVYFQMAILAEKLGTSQSLDLAKQRYTKCLELDLQNYRDEPNFFTRDGLSVTYLSLADIALQKGSQESFNEAEKLYILAKEYIEQNHRELPCYQSRASLSMIYSRLGELYSQKGTAAALTQARQRYQSALELDRENYLETPGYDSRQRLSISYDKMGDIYLRDMDIAQAEIFFTKMLELDTRNYRENPCFESRGNLAAAYSRMGDLSEEKDTPQSRAEAEEWYQKELELNLQQYAENPCYDSRRRLSINYTSLYYLEQKKEAPDSLRNAQVWCRKSLELDEENYRINPCYHSRRDLSLSCGKLSDLMYQIGTGKARTEGRKLLMKSLELNEENHRLTPCYQTRRDLSIAYEQLAYLEESKDTARGYAAAEKWLMKQLELLQINHEENPCYENRKDLAELYERLGHCAGGRGSAKGWKQAETWFLEKVRLSERLLQEKPCYSNRLSLSVTYGRLGYIARWKKPVQSLSESEAWSRKCLPLDEENYRENPCQESRYRFNNTLNQLGNILLKKETDEALAEAERLLRRALDLYPEGPSEASDYALRDSLAYSYGSLANVLQQKGTEESLAEAELRMKEAAALEEENLRENNCDETRFSLSVTYDTLSDLSLDRKDPDGAYGWQIKALELDRENYREDPDEYGDSLLTTYEKLADLARRIGTPEALAEAKNWDALRTELEACIREEGGEYDE